MTATALIYEVEDEIGESALDERTVQMLGAERRTVESLSRARVDVHYIEEFRKDRDEAFAVIVLDLMFPDTEDSSDAIQFICDVRAGNLMVHKLTPILVHSNAGGNSTEEEALRAGATGFYRKSLDPEPYLEALEFYTGAEVAVACVGCEIERINLAKQTVAVKILGDNGWFATRHFDLDFCPEGTTIEGGAFYLETIKRYRDFRTEYLLRSRAVDASHEEDLLREWLS